MKGLTKHICVAMAASIMLVGTYAAAASATVERFPGEGLSCATPLLGEQLSEAPLYTSLGSETLAYGACQVSGAVEGFTRFSPDGLTMTVSAKHRSSRGEAVGFWSATGPIAGAGLSEVCLNEEVLSVSVHSSSRPSEFHHEAGVWQTVRVDGGLVSRTFAQPGPLTFCFGGSPLPEQFEWISWITARAIKDVGVNASVTVKLNSVTLK